MTSTNRAGQLSARLPLEDPTELARFQSWSESVYRDLLAVDRGGMSYAEFDEKYLSTAAVLILDITGFTASAIDGGAIGSFLRILDVQKICFPVFRECGATFVRAFADDVTAVFDDCNQALDAALEIQRRVDLFTASADRHEDPPQCCIGIGYGDIYRIGSDLAMGDEMNRASKLGEDTALGGETLVTENAYRALSQRADAKFEPQVSDDLVFPYYRVTAAVGRPPL